MTTRQRSAADTSRSDENTGEDLASVSSLPNNPASESTGLLFVTSPISVRRRLAEQYGSPVGPDSSPEYVTLPIESPGEEEEEAHIPAENAERRSRASWLGVLMLPGRIAVGALSFLAGTGISRRSGLPRAAVVLSGCVSVFLGQVFVTAVVHRARRRRDEEGARAERAREEQMAWLDAIQAVGKIVGTFSDGLRGPHAMRHIFLDTSLIRMMHDKTLRSSALAAASKPSTPTDALMLGRHYLDYALATYGFMMLKVLGIMDPTYNPMTEGTRGVDVAQYMLRLRPDQMLVSMLDGEGINVPRHFVALDEDQKSIVVAIRGTNSISDIITDLLCENEPFAGGYAHSGMKTAAESLFSSILPTLRSALAEHPTYSIAITGHSLGAGVAILLTKVMQLNGITDVKCYAIAPCPVFGPMHCVDSDWSDALECFVHLDDLVSKLCLSSARYLALEVEHIDALSLNVADKKHMINTQDTERLEELLLSQRERTADPREKHVQQLYIPTHHGVHWLVPDEEDTSHFARQKGSDVDPFVGMAYVPSRRYNSFVVRPRLFEKILVTPGCVSAHFPSSYTSAFAGLDLPARQVAPPPPPKIDFSRQWYANELG